ncbi:MAG: hypothetical protein R2850_12430 [Bacteroidia bacterium]
MLHPGYVEHAVCIYYFANSSFIATDIFATSKARPISADIPVARVVETNKTGDRIKAGCMQFEAIQQFMENTEYKREISVQAGNHKD